MNHAPSGKRRRFQFSLRTLLVVVAVGGALGGWLGSGLREQWRQQRVARELERVGGVCWWDGRPWWLGKVLGRHCLQSVVELRFKGSQATDAALEHVAVLGELGCLDLEGGNITDAGLAHLRAANQLEWLRLDGTKVTDAGLAHVGGLGRLERLALKNTTVTDAGLKYLAGLTRLTDLELSGTKVSVEGVGRLEMCLPNCQISFSEAILHHCHRADAKTWLDLGNDGAAIAGITGAIGALPYYPEDYRMRAEIYSRKGDKAAAERDLGKAVELERQEPQRLAIIAGIKAMPQPQRRGLPSTRWALLLAGAGAVPCGWLAVKAQQARRQRAAAATIVSLGGEVGWNEPRGPRWLWRLLGSGRFNSVGSVGFYGPGPGPEYPAELSRLQLSSAGSESVTDAGLELLAGFGQLRQLTVRSPGVTNAGLKHLARLSRLSSLALRDTKVTDAGLKYLEGLKRLGSLGLEGAKVTDAGLRHLTRLSKLQDLNLGHTRVTDLGLKDLTGLHHLQKLRLGFTGVTDAGLAHLEGLRQLRVLELLGTNVTDRGVRSLQQALPKCHVGR